jgi:hypothetical protein
MALLNNVQLAQKEGRFTLAVQAFKDGYFSSKRACTNTYDILESTLRRHVKGINTQYDSVPVNQKLTQTEETTLVK